MKFFPFSFANSLTVKDGKNAASLFVAEQYVTAFKNLARTNNTLILPSNVGDISSLVGQALAIYKTVANSNDLGKDEDVLSRESLSKRIDQNTNDGSNSNENRQKD